MLPDVPIIQLCRLLGRNVGCTGDEVAHFHQAVDAYEDRVVAFGERELDDEVHRN